MSLLKKVPPPKRPETIPRRERQLRWDGYTPWRYVEGDEIEFEGKRAVVESANGEYVCLVVDGEFIARHISFVKDPNYLWRIKNDVIDYCCRLDCRLTDKPAPMSEFLAAPRQHIPSLYGCTVFVWNSNTKVGFFYISDQISSIEAVSELKKRGKKEGVPEEFDSEYHSAKRDFHFFHLVDGAWIEVFRGMELDLMLKLITARFIPQQHQYPSQRIETTSLTDWLQIAGSLGFFYNITKELRDQPYKLDLPDITEFDFKNFGKRLSKREDTPDYFCNVDPNEVLDTETDLH